MSWILEHRAQEKKSSPSSGDGDTASSTLFEVIDNSKLPEEDKSTNRLVDEAVGITVAGSETTAKILTRTAYELMSSPSVLMKAREELANGALQLEQPRLELVDLGKLPYLASTPDRPCEMTAC